VDRRTIKSLALHAHTNPGVHHRFLSPLRKSLLVGIITSFALLVLLGPMQVAQAHTHISATNGTWTLTGSMNVARYEHTATLLPNGKVLVAGGFVNGIGAISSAELYDPSSGTWTPTGSLNDGRYGHTATLLPNGKVLVAGGSDNNSCCSALAELYDPSSGTWTLTGSMNAGRFGDTATLLPNGKVLVAGGFGGCCGFLASAELYDPSSGTWTLTGSMNEVHLDHTATLLPNGKVLVAGGVDNDTGGVLALAELYDPSSGTWTPTGSMNTARYEHTATLLPNGKVLVVGGLVSSVSIFSSAELYDPSSGTWTLTGSMNTARYQHTATLLPNGQVLVAGGNIGQALALADLYDPSSGTWTPTSSMNVARSFHTATLLPNGQVLVAGGFNNSGDLVSAELFSQPDTTPPVLQLPGTITVDATSPGGAVVTYTVTATDPDNPPSQLTISCSPASGSTFPIGTTTVNCSASDPAGNTTTGTFVVHVEGAAEQTSDLTSQVNSFNLSSQGTQTSFDGQLQSVQADLAANNTAQACNDLTSFINHVNAQSGKKLTVAQANQLLAAATRIQAVLGC
jgi:N-acetylneuraminic acid mutarotase